VGCHRPTVEVSIPVIRAVLRAFEIPDAAFWAEEWNAVTRDHD